jgi:4,5-DOPA dioxygenase extradiol
MIRPPSLFISHGAPTILIEESPVRSFLMGLGEELGRPEAILVVSAHWETPLPTLQWCEQPETIHDFRGFPDELYQVVYGAKGSPGLAARTAALLVQHFGQVERDDTRGYDHGAWVPLALMYPDAEIPVVQLSLQPHQPPEYQYLVGEVLRPLRDEGVLVIGSGNLTHNIQHFREHGWDDPPEAWVREFADWMNGAIAEGRKEDLLDYRARAPHAERNHPQEEHLLPLFVALGAGDAGGKGRRLHTSATHGTLMMDVFAFG